MGRQRRARDHRIDDRRLAGVRTPIDRNAREELQRAQPDIGAAVVGEGCNGHGLGHAVGVCGLGAQGDGDGRAIVLHGNLLGVCVPADRAAHILDDRAQGQHGVALIEGRAGTLGVNGRRRSIDRHGGAANGQRDRAGGLRFCREGGRDHGGHQAEGDKERAQSLDEFHSLSKTSSFPMCKPAHRTAHVLQRIPCYPYSNISDELEQ